MNTKKQMTLADAVLAYMAAMKTNYEAGKTGTFGEYKMFAMPGQKFVRLVHHIDYDGREGQKSSHCFIVKKDFTHANGMSFKQGDILACATWHAPAINKTIATTVRGNVMQKYYGKSSWTGAGYV